LAFAELAQLTDGLLLTFECAAPVGSEQDGARGEDGTRGEDEAPGDGSDAVNYVNGDIPLYYREWGRIFAELGMVEVETRPFDRDTLRAFRHG
jgi:hypothetical protein